jgi:hypothetical protein
MHVARRSSVDPKGKIDRTYSDDAGRTVRTIQNYVAGAGCFCPGSEQNVTTEMRYGSGDQLLQLIAKNPDTGDQVTQYVYGVTLGQFGDRQQRSAAGGDLSRCAGFHRSRDVYLQPSRPAHFMTDQNGSVHEYYTTCWAGQPATLCRRWALTSMGPCGASGRRTRCAVWSKITSYSDAAGTTLRPTKCRTSTTASAARYAVPGTWGRGEHGTTSPKVEYAYADGSNNTIRPTTMTYPNGRVLQYLYDDTAC